MGNINKIICIFALLTLQHGANAIEPSAAIKVTPLLKTQTSWNGTPISYPEGKAEITGMMIEIAPGAETGWHLHEVPSFGTVLEGELDVHLQDGRINHLKKGDSLAEVINTIHNGHAVGNTPVKIIVFYAGAEGKKLTIKVVPAPQQETRKNNTEKN